ncbi:MAG: DNA phosphorothioation-associated protein 4 [Pseudomonadales bacterium]
MSNDVRRPKEHEEMLSALCQSDRKVFNSYKDALVFAACLGQMRHEKRAFDKSSEPVGIHIFRGEFDLSIMQCIALAENKDPATMADAKEESRIRLFEEYACGGLDIINREIYESPEDWDVALERLMLEAMGGGTRTILEDITSLA